MRGDGTTKISCLRRWHGGNLPRIATENTPMNLKWATERGAELLGRIPFEAVKRKHRRHAAPHKIERFQLPFRQWDGPIGADFGKGRGQVYSLDGRKPNRSCNEVEVAKILRRIRDHAFWFSAYPTVKMPETWRPWVLSTSELPHWLKNLDSAIRERINSPGGGMPDIVAWNDGHPSRSALFVECKAAKEGFGEAQEDWLWAALCKGIKVSQFAVSIRAF